MARTPIAGGGSSISPFRGGGGSFGAFNIGTSPKAPASGGGGNSADQQKQAVADVAPSRQAYLQLQLVEADYAAGRASDDAYRSAMAAYYATLDAADSTAINLKQRIETFDRTVARNKLVFAINEGTKQLEDLLAFDKNALNGVDPGSQEYRDRVSQYEQTEQAVFSKQERMVVDAYNAGKSTAAQLRDWYENALTQYTDNKDIIDRVTGQVTTLDSQVQSARDKDMVAKWRNGTISPSDFVLYAASVRDRYVVGSDQRTQWEGYITDANDGAKETLLTERYKLTIQIAALQDAIGSGSSLTSRKGTKRTIIDANGNAVTVTENTGPSASQQAAYARHTADIAAAKKELAVLQARLDYFGGPVSSQTMVAYYTKRQASVVKGTPQWFDFQSRIDTLNEQAAKAAVTAGQRVRAGAAGGGGGATGPQPGGASSNAPAVGTSDFLAVYGSKVSGSNHAAVSPTGARFGKYQFTPAQWSTYAAKYMGDAHAPMTPDNQEHVAEQLASDLYKRYGDWGRVAEVMNPSGGSQFANTVRGSLGIVALRKTAGINVTGAPVGKVTVQTVTGGRANAINEEGPAQPGVKTNAPATLAAYTYKPQALVDMDKAAYEKFYTAAKQAYRNGELSFTFITNGQAVTYALPNDPGQRSSYMANLDNKRIELRRQDTITYAGTKAGITKSASMQTAINDAATNQYIALDLSQGVAIDKKNPKAGGQTMGGERLGTPIPSATNWSRQPDGTVAPTPNPNAPIESQTPLALGVQYVAMQKDYIATQVRLAKQALAKNDFNGAWAYSQLATNAYVQTQAYTTHLSGLAQQRMDEIARSTGETTLPDKIKPDIEYIAGGWDTGEGGIHSLMQDLDSTVGVPLIGSKDDSGKQGALVMEGTGDNRHPKLNADGSVSLKPDLTVVFDAAGGSKIVPVEKPGFNDAGTGLSTNMPGMLPIRVNSGGTIVDGWLKYTENVKVGVARTADGTTVPLYGKSATTVIDGKRYSVFENPLAPGTFISLPGDNPTPPVYTTPTSFKPVSTMNPDGTVRAVGYEWVQNGMVYRLVQDTGSSQYIVSVSDGKSPGGWSTYDPAKDKNIQADLVAGGWGLDANSIPEDSRLAAGTQHAWAGEFSAADILSGSPELLKQIHDSNAPYQQAMNAKIAAMNIGPLQAATAVERSADPKWQWLQEHRLAAASQWGGGDHPGKQADDAMAPKPVLTAAQPTTQGPLPTILPPTTGTAGHPGKLADENSALVPPPKPALVLTASERAAQNPKPKPLPKIVPPKKRQTTAVTKNTTFAS